MHTLVLAILLQISVLHPLKLFVGYTKSFNPALLLMACCLFGSGMHTFGIVANPQDIAPSHAGSVFGIMNAGGAIPGTFIFVLFFLTGVTSSFTLAVLLTTVAMFAKSFHSFGSGISPLDIAPKHAGFVHGIVNSAGSFAGKER